MKKPYLVTIEIEFAAMAENENEAKKFCRDAINDFSPIEYCCYVSPLTRYPDGYEKGCLVYVDDDRDITIEEALEQSEEYQKTRSRMKQIVEDFKKTDKKEE